MSAYYKCSCGGRMRAVVNIKCEVEPIPQASEDGKYYSKIIDLYTDRQVSLAEGKAHLIRVKECVFECTKCSEPGEPLDHYLYDEDKGRVIDNYSVEGICRKCSRSADLYGKLLLCAPCAIKHYLDTGEVMDNWYAGCPEDACRCYPVEPGSTLLHCDCCGKKYELEELLNIDPHEIHKRLYGTHSHNS